MEKIDLSKATIGSKWKCVDNKGCNAFYTHGNVYEVIEKHEARWLTDNVSDLPNRIEVLISVGLKFELVSDSPEPDWVPRVGDVVECVCNAGSSRDHEIGKEYTVVRVERVKDRITEAIDSRFMVFTGAHSAMFCGRFKLLRRAREKEEASNVASPAPESKRNSDSVGVGANRVPTEKTSDVQQCGDGKKAVAKNPLDTYPELGQSELVNALGVDPDSKMSLRISLLLIQASGNINALRYLAKFDRQLAIETIEKQVDRLQSLKSQLTTKGKAWRPETRNPYIVGSY